MPRRMSRGQAMEVRQAYELLRGVVTAARGPTVRELWKRFAPVAEKTHRSWASDRGRVSHLLRHLGTRRASELTPADRDWYWAQRSEETTRFGRPPAVATINREMALLSATLTYAVKAGGLAANPFDGMAPLDERGNVRRSAMTETDVERLLAHCDARLRAFVLVAFDSGMRRGEIVNLRVSQIQSDGTVLLAAADTKTNEPRVPILTGRAMKACADLWQAHGNDWLFFNRMTLAPYNERTIYKWFVAARDKAGLRGAGAESLWIHTMRHSFVRNSRKRGVPESVIMKQTGHKTRETFARYNLVDLDDVRAARERFEAGIARELQGQRRAPRRAMRRALTENRQRKAPAKNS